MKIFLCSYFKGVEKLFKEFAGDNVSGKKVVFIPTAGIHEEVNFYIDEAKEVFEDLGMKIDILDISSESSEVIQEKIFKAEYLYVSGGNTFFLLENIRNKNLEDLVSDRVKNGMVYIGESAGAMVASPDIEYVKFMDEMPENIHLKEFRALNLISGYPVVHNGEFPFEEATAKILSEYGNKLKLLPVNNEEAIIFTDSGYEIKR